MGQLTAQLREMRERMSSLFRKVWNLLAAIGLSKILSLTFLKILFELNGN